MKSLLEDICRFLCFVRTSKAIFWYIMTHIIKTLKTLIKISDRKIIDYKKKVDDILELESELNEKIRHVIKQVTSEYEALMLIPKYNYMFDNYYNNMEVYKDKIREEIQNTKKELIHYNEKLKNEFFEKRKYEILLEKKVIEKKEHERYIEDKIFDEMRMIIAFRKNNMQDDDP